jgi:hypothetical protein
LPNGAQKLVLPFCQRIRGWGPVTSEGGSYLKETGSGVIIKFRAGIKVGDYA